MIRRLRVACLAIILLTPINTALAQIKTQSQPRTKAETKSSPLTLDEVLASSARSAPQIIEALARVRQSEGRALSAEGAFDTVFDVNAETRLSGFYDGKTIEAVGTRPLTNNGGSISGSYRNSRGDFPIYEDESFTNKLGELKISGVYSLMRDRVTDPRRTQLGIASRDIDAAKLDAAMVEIGVQRRAISAYQNWVAAGLRFRAFRELLDIAEERRGATQRQVALGGRAAILLVEVEQVIARRRGQVVRAEQDLAVAANGLSFFFRDVNGEPIIVSRDRLPNNLVPLQPPRDATPNRPDLATILVRIDQSIDRLALAENELRPRLDLTGELSNDFGAEGVGGSSRTGAETIVGVKFRIPLENRAAKGRVSEVRAELSALRIRQRLIEDQIKVDLRGFALTVDGSAEVADLADREVALALQLAAAERKLFNAGASSFFLINAREEAANDALVRSLEARLRLADAQADLAAAFGDRGLLGLREGIAGSQ